MPASGAPERPALLTLLLSFRRAGPWRTGDLDGLLPAFSMTTEAARINPVASADRGPEKAAEPVGHHRRGDADPELAKAPPQQRSPGEHPDRGPGGEQRHPDDDAGGHDRCGPCGHKKRQDRDGGPGG